MSKIESAETIFNKANAAFVDENFTEALELYNTAIEMDPTNAEYYVKRAACHYRLKQFTGTDLKFDKMTLQPFY
jgi:suppressor of G2 allele of SKP1